MCKVTVFLHTFRFPQKGENTKPATFSPQKGDLGIIKMIKKLGTKQNKNSERVRKSINAHLLTPYYFRRDLADFILQSGKISLCVKIVRFIVANRVFNFQFLTQSPFPFPCPVQRQYPVCPGTKQCGFGYFAVRRL